VIDGVSNAIYVIGGVGTTYGFGTTYYHDVWVSTDGGADRRRGCSRGYLGGSKGYSTNTQGYSRVPGGTGGVLGVHTGRVLAGKCRVLA
jgi:hypothetical protein